MAGSSKIHSSHVKNLFALFRKLGTEIFLQLLAVLIQLAGDSSGTDCTSVHISISRLWSLLILDHFILEADQYLFHIVLWVP